MPHGWEEQVAAGLRSAHTGSGARSCQELLHTQHPDFTHRSPLRSWLLLCFACFSSAPAIPVCPAPRAFLWPTEGQPEGRRCAPCACVHAPGRHSSLVCAQSSHFLLTPPSSDQCTAVCGISGFTPAAARARSRVQQGAPGAPALVQLVLWRGQAEQGREGRRRSHSDVAIGVSAGECHGHEGAAHAEPQGQVHRAGLGGVGETRGGPSSEHWRGGRELVLFPPEPGRRRQEASWGVEAGPQGQGNRVA